MAGQGSVRVKDSGKLSRLARVQKNFIQLISPGFGALTHTGIPIEHDNVKRMLCMAGSMSQTATEGELTGQQPYRKLCSLRKRDSQQPLVCDIWPVSVVLTGSQPRADSHKRPPESQPTQRLHPLARLANKASHLRLASSIHIPTSGARQFFAGRIRVAMANARPNASSKLRVDGQSGRRTSARASG